MEMLDTFRKSFDNESQFVTVLCGSLAARIGDEGYMEVLDSIRRSFSSERKFVTFISGCQVISRLREEGWLLAVDKVKKLLGSSEQAISTIMTGAFAASLNEPNFYSELQSWESSVGKNITVKVISILAKFIFHLRDFRNYLSKSSEWTQLVSQELVKQLRQISMERDYQVKEVVWLKIKNTLKKEGSKQRGPTAIKKGIDFTEAEKEMIRQTNREDQENGSTYKLAATWGTSRGVIRGILS
jgi:hypothetical protein